MFVEEAAQKKILCGSGGGLRGSWKLQLPLSPQPTLRLWHRKPTNTCSTTHFLMWNLTYPRLLPLSSRPPLTMAKLFETPRHWRFVLHGGCAETCPDPDRQQDARENLEAIACKVRDALMRGDRAKDAVVLAVSALEDCPVFNAGRGAALTRSGIHQVSNPPNRPFSSVTSVLMSLHSSRRASPTGARQAMGPSAAPRRPKTQFSLPRL